MMYEEYLDFSEGWLTRCFEGKRIGDEGEGVIIPKDKIKEFVEFQKKVDGEKVSLFMTERGGGLTIVVKTINKDNK